MHFVAMIAVIITLGQAHDHTQCATTRNDGRFMDWVRRRFMDRYNRMSGFMIGGHFLFVFGHDHGLTLGAHHYLIFGILKLLHCDQAFATTCGKQPVQVKDRAGFIVNALLFPYLNNAIRMLEQGTANMEDIDTAMKGGCNFPMGPFALLDLVGLDTSLSILDALYNEFRDPNYAAMPTLRRMVAAGQLGRKSKAGFYSY